MSGSASARVDRGVNDHWWTPLATAARRNLVPGLILQAIALVLVGTYYFVPAAHGPFDTVARWKVDGGYFFAAISTALAAGFIPWLIDRLRGTSSARYPYIDGLFVCAIWAYRGAEIDAFYHLQAWLFGSGHDVGTVACKVAFDMFAYAPLWAQPTMVALYVLRKYDFNISALRRDWYWPRFVREVLVIQTSGWIVWIPTVCIVYSLPSPLQFPLFAIMVCFWSLLLVALTEKPTKTQA